MKWFAYLFAALVLLSAGCKDEDSPAGTGKSGGTTEPTIDNIWPNDDQTEWSYDYTWHENPLWDPALYESLHEVPPLPDWSEIAGYLELPFDPDSIQTMTATFKMKFDGRTTSGSGVDGQNLVQTYQFDPAGEAVILDPVSAERDLLRRLLVVRPQRRSALSDPGASAVTPLVPPPVLSPQFIHGGTWEKAEEWIGTYALERTLAWKFLTDDLEPGTEFTHQLLPTLVDDMFLHCRIVRQFDVDTDHGVLENAIECLYLVDWGVSVQFDDEAQVLGYFRPFDYGRVIYAPTVGPVYSHGRRFGDESAPLGIHDLELILIDSTTLGD